MRSSLALQISAMLASSAGLRIIGDSTYRRMSVWPVASQTLVPEGNGITAGDAPSSPPPRPR